MTEFSSQPAPPAGRFSPRIGVVIPCYNSEKWIERTIGSALDQSWHEKRVIVVDDGSTDASAEKVRAWGDRVILESGPNSGACHARNRGMEIAKGMECTHVLFLDADDYLEGEMLAGVAEVAVETRADIILSNMHLQHYDGRREERYVYDREVAPTTFFEGWMRGNYFNPSAIVWRIGFVERIGGWDESLARAQDMDITLRAMFFNPKIFKNNHGAAIYVRGNSASISRNDGRKATDSRMRAIKGLIELAPGTPFEPFLPLLNGELYSITRTALRTAQHDLAQIGLSTMKAHNYRDHPGTWQHKALARILGLERKVRLWGA